MNEVKLGVIGCGGRPLCHMRDIECTERLKFVAATDISQKNLQAVVDQYHVEGFDDADAMFDSRLIDAVFIGTPHYFHPKYSIEAMKRGLHVLTDKPVSVTAKAAAEVNALHAQHNDLVYAAMFQYHSMAKWEKVKEIIGSDELQYHHQRARPAVGQRTIPLAAPAVSRYNRRAYIELGVTDTTSSLITELGIICRPAISNI